VAGRQALGAPQRDHSGWVRSLRFSPDGDRLASTADDGTVILRDRGGVRLANTPPLNVLSGTVYGHAFHPQDEALAVSVGADAIVAQWGGSEPLARPLSAHRGAVFQALWSADGTQVVTASADGSVLIWDAATARLTGSPITAQGQVLSLALHGETLAFATDSGQIALWDTAAGSMTASVDIGTAVRSLAFDPVSGLLASAGDDGVIRLWDVAAFTNPVAELAAHTDWVNTVAFSPDGALLASGGADARVLLWDVESRSILSELPAVYANMVTALAFSPDGDLLASASRDGSARLWSISGEGWVGTEMIHDGRWILDVDFSPGGDLLATVSQSGSVQLWEVSSQQAVGLPLSGHADWALSVSFHPDGRGLVSTSRDQTARLWSIDPVDWQERACAKANRALTIAEVNRYFGGEPGALVCTG
jgi:WD40 repeat protein